MDLYYKAYHNVIRMLTDRGYKTDTGDTDLSVFRHSLTDFEVLYAQIGSGSLDIKGVQDRKGKQVYVRFIQPDSDITQIKSHTALFTHLKPISDMLSMSLDSVDDLGKLLNDIYIIVVYNGVPGKDNVYSPPAIEKKLPRESIQLFPIQRLTFCILDAAFMPESIRLLSAAEEKEAIGMYGPQKLERFAVNDPIVKYFGADVGDTFEIIRKSPEGRSISWRKVAGVQAPQYNKK